MELVGAPMEPAGVTPAPAWDWSIGLAVLGVLAVGAWWWGRRRKEGLERAFVRLAGAMGLDARERERVRRVAASGGGMAPVVLLISEQALERACAAAARRGRLSAVDVAAIEALRRRMSSQPPTIRP